MDDDWVRFNMQLRPPMAEVLDAEAASLGISRAALIRVIVARHIKENEK